MNDEVNKIAYDSLQDIKVINIRHELAKTVALAFINTAEKIKNTTFEALVQRIPTENKLNLEEESNAISLIMEIAGDLTQSANILFLKNNTYSACSLIRQLVEIEYLVYTFECDNDEAHKWIRSTKEERFKYFSPSKLRKAAQGKFRSKDYSYHCELGGHPVPLGAKLLLNNENSEAQLMLSDMITHIWNIWDHLVNWAMSNYSDHPILRESLRLIDKFDHWKEMDKSTLLPPPP